MYSYSRDTTLVFDGIERLLRQSGDPECGYAYSWGVKNLLKTIGDCSGHSTVIITSRMWPLEFSQPAEGFSARRVWTERIGQSAQALIKNAREGPDLAGHRLLHQAAGIPMMVRPGIYCHEIDQLPASELSWMPGFKQLKSDVSSKLPGFCRLLEGNVYAVHLANTLLEHIQKEIS